MTPAEHAKVWRKAANDLSMDFENSKSLVAGAVFCLASAIADAYEQAAKEQERHE